jgi:hypothetical protein
LGASIVGAHVASAYGAAQFYGAKLSAAKDLTTRLGNDGTVVGISQSGSRGNTSVSVRNAQPADPQHHPDKANNVPRQIRRLKPAIN